MGCVLSVGESVQNSGVACCGGSLAYTRNAAFMFMCYLLIIVPVKWLFCKYWNFMWQVSVSVDACPE